MIANKRIVTLPLDGERHLVCNALTGALSVLDAKALRTLELTGVDNDTTVDPALQSTLERQQLIFTSKEDEDLAFRRLCDEGLHHFRAHAPRSFTFVLNTHCNFACSYCFEKAFDAPAETLSASQIDSAFRIVDELCERDHALPSPVFEIFGGEPLLPGTTGALSYLLSRIADRAAKATLHSNGFHLADNLDLIETYKSNIGQIQITLDGPRPVHDMRRASRNGRPTFDRIVGAIRRLCERDLPIRLCIRMNVDRNNIDMLGAMVEVYQSNGWLQDERFTFVAAPVDNRCGRLAAPETLVTWGELFTRVLPLSKDTGGGPFDLSVFKPIAHFRDYFGSLAASLASGRPELAKFIPKVMYCEATDMKLFVFHPDGRIYPCPESIGLQHHAIGSFDPAFRIDSHSANKWLNQTILSRDHCRDCAVSTFCGGGCTLLNATQGDCAGAIACENARDILEAYLGQVCTKSALRRPVC